MKELNNNNNILGSICENFCEFVNNFHERFMEKARKELQLEVQNIIENIEKELKGSYQKRKKKFYTPFGIIELSRRAYKVNSGIECIVDNILNLPENGWSPEVEELKCALGINVEFLNAQRIFTKWTGIEISDHGLLNQVENIGKQLSEKELNEKAKEILPLENALTLCVKKDLKMQEKPIIYIGIDGIMVPLNNKQGYKEGKVGVIFWENDHFKISPKRKEIRKKEYISTMNNREIFGELVYKRYTHLVGTKSCRLVFLGDGAHWIWEMAKQYFPEAIQILDFFHVTEYIWEVARNIFTDEKKQRKWVKIQTQRLKKSQWEKIINSLNLLKNPSSQLKESIESLKTYLLNNSERIDYKNYLEHGYMIGSGVVESSNKKIVTQRLKQSGMHWSKEGANNIMTLRACYFSSSDRWQNFWNLRAS
jgi:hypothetical protein